VSEASRKPRGAKSGVMRSNRKVVQLHTPGSRSHLLENSSLVVVAVVATALSGRAAASINAEPAVPFWLLNGTAAVGSLPWGLPTASRDWFDHYLSSKPPAPSGRTKCITHGAEAFVPNGIGLGAEGASRSCNLFNVRVLKCASSTAAGVTRRIAAHHAIPDADKRNADLQPLPRWKNHANSASGHDIYRYMQAHRHDFWEAIWDIQEKKIQKKISDLADCCPFQLERLNTSGISVQGIGIVHGVPDRAWPRPAFVRASHGMFIKGGPELYSSEGPSFLWTTVRDPAERTMSSYYFFHTHVHTPNGTFGTEEDKLASLAKRRDTKLGYYITEYLNVWGGEKLDGNCVDSMSPSVDVKATTATKKCNLTPDEVFAKNRRIVAAIFAEYDFIGVAERFDESMVVLAALTNVPLSDVLYTIAKDHSHNATLESGATLHLKLSDESDAVKRILKGPEKVNEIWPDRILHQQANEVLDMYMAVPGMHDMLQEFKRIKAIAHATCADSNPAFAQLGKREMDSIRQCYVLDVGCWYTCLDALFGTRSVF